MDKTWPNLHILAISKKKNYIFYPKDLPNSHKWLINKISLYKKKIIVMSHIGWEGEQITIYKGVWKPSDAF